MNNYDKKIMAEVQDEVLELMEKHDANWLKPFEEIMSHSFPENFCTKKKYNGFNIFWLSIMCRKKGYDMNAWGTYDQWFKLGGGKKEKIDGKWKITEPSTYNVKAKEKATKVFYWELKTYEDKNNLDKNGDPTTKSRWFLKVWNVFNIAQIEGIDYKSFLPEEAKVKFNDNNFTEVKEFVANTRAEVRTGASGAFYSPTLDYIQMPNKESFNDTDTSDAGQNYYSTLLHELVHWTGHKTRCDRKFSSKSDAYAMEELVAETGSAMLCVLLNVCKKPRADHAKYLNHWKKVIRNNPRAIFTAFTKSTQALEFLDNLTNNKERKVA